MWIIEVDNFRWVKSCPEAASVVLCFGLNLRCFQTPQLWRINMPTICMFLIINTWMYDGRITSPTWSETTRWTFTETWDQLEKEIRQPQVTAIILVARVLNHNRLTVAVRWSSKTCKNRAPRFSSKSFYPFPLFFAEKEQFPPLQKSLVKSSILKKLGLWSWKSIRIHKIPITWLHIVCFGEPSLHMEMVG